MKRKSISQKIIEYLKQQNCWVNGKQIEDYISDTGNKGSTASRICRTLAEEGKINRKEDTSVWYSYEKQPVIREKIEIIDLEDGRRVARKIQVTEYI